MKASAKLWFVTELLSYSAWSRRVLCLNVWVAGNTESVNILIQDEGEGKPGEALLWKAARIASSHAELSPHDVCRAHQLFAGAALLQRYASTCPIAVTMMSVMAVRTIHIASNSDGDNNSTDACEGR